MKTALVLLIVVMIVASFALMAFAPMSVAPEAVAMKRPHNDWCNYQVQRCVYLPGRLHARKS